MYSNPDSSSEEIEEDSASDETISDAFSDEVVTEVIVSLLELVEDAFSEFLDALLTAVLSASQPISAQKARIESSAIILFSKTIKTPIT